MLQNYPLTKGQIESFVLALPTMLGVNRFLFDNCSLSGDQLA